MRKTMEEAAAVQLKTTMAEAVCKCFVQHWLLGR
jgi:hypothetical protein